MRTSRNLALDAMRRRQVFRGKETEAFPRIHSVGASILVCDLNCKRKTGRYSFVSGKGLSLLARGGIEFFKSAKMGSMIKQNKGIFLITTVILCGLVSLLPSPCWAIGPGANQLGIASTASGSDSVTLGYGSSASGIAATALGYGAQATAQDASALGIVATANGWYSVAIGGNSMASGVGAVTLGYSSTAGGDHSVAGGVYTTAQGVNQFVVGIYNIPQGDLHAWIETDDLFIVGNGSDVAHPSNAFTIRKNGDAEIGGRLTVDGPVCIAPQGDLSMGSFTSVSP